MLAQLSTTCSNYWSIPMVNSLLQSTTTSYGQWRQRRHPTASWTVLSERLVHSMNRCSSATAGILSCNLATFSMGGNNLAYAATQGIYICIYAEWLFLHIFSISQFFKCNWFWFLILYCEISNYFFCCYIQDNQECYCSWICSCKWNYYSKTISM